MKTRFEQKRIGTLLIILMGIVFIGAVIGIVALLANEKAEKSNEELNEKQDESIDENINQKQDGSRNEGSSGSITIGVITDISQQYISKEMMRAIEEINSSRGDVEFIVKDAKNTIVDSLTALRELNDEGVVFVVSSHNSEVSEAMVNYANQFNMILIGINEGSPLFSIPNDNYIRLRPDDLKTIRFTGPFVFNELNSQVIIPVFVSNYFGNTFETGQTLFGNGRGNTARMNVSQTNTPEMNMPVVVHPPTYYSITNNELSEELKKLSLISEFYRLQGFENITVILVSYDEVQRILQHVNKDSNLIQNTYVVMDYSARRPITVPLNSSSNMDVFSVSYAPSSYDLTYDAVMSIIENENRNTNLNTVTIFDELKEEYIMNLKNIEGKSGTMILNEFDDRESLEYTVQRLEITDEGNKWIRN